LNIWSKFITVTNKSYIFLNLLNKLSTYNNFIELSLKSSTQAKNKSIYFKNIMRININELSVCRTFSIELLYLHWMNYSIDMRDIGIENKFFQNLNDNVIFVCMSIFNSRYNSIWTELSDFLLVKNKTLININQ